jgi:hypothetical protein
VYSSNPRSTKKTGKAEKGGHRRIYRNKKKGKEKRKLGSSQELRGAVWLRREILTSD